jgi:outer membrane protein assembly factor BamB
MIEGAPIVVEQQCLVASADKHLYCLDVATGKELWKSKVGICRASPAVQGKRVVIGNINGEVFCLDRTSGEQVWKYEAVGGEIASGCNFHGSNVLVAAQGMPLTCLNDQGKVLWTFEIDGGSNGTPTVDGDTVFASGCDALFHVIDAKTGKEIWSVEVPGQSASTTAVCDGVAYLGTVTNQVIAIDLKSKTKLWEFEARRKPQAFYSSCAVADDLVVVGCRDRKIYALDRKTGAERWSYITEGSVDASPAIVGQRVFVGCLSLTGEFYVLNLKDGKQLQEITLDSAVTGSTAVGPKCVLVGTEKGTVYCFGAKTQ